MFWNPKKAAFPLAFKIQILINNKTHEQKKCVLSIVLLQKSLPNFWTKHYDESLTFPIIFGNQEGNRWEDERQGLFSPVCSISEFKFQMSGKETRKCNSSSFVNKLLTRRLQRRRDVKVFSGWTFPISRRISEISWNEWCGCWGSGTERIGLGFALALRIPLPSFFNQTNERSWWRWPTPLILDLLTLNAKSYHCTQQQTSRSLFATSTTGTPASTLPKHPLLLNTPTPSRYPNPCQAR